MNRLIITLIVSGILMTANTVTAGSNDTTTEAEDVKLSPCPDRPNCVSSISADEKHAILPFSYTGSREAAMEVLKYVINNEPYTRITKQTDNYLHAEFKTRWMRFTDDVEFYFPEEDGVIHIRSASRIGYSDLGKNRKRMEKLSETFTKTLKSHQ